MKLINIIKHFLVLAICLLPLVTQAQTDPDDPGGDPDEVPIDGGASLLIGATVVYGAKKLKDRKHTDK